MDIFNHNDDRRHRLFNGRQRDPTRQGKASDTPYFRKGHGRVLMPDSFMPVGEHAGKHLRAVPTEYLLWVNAQPWSKTWTPWQPVHDFIERFITSDPETANTAALPAGPVIFLTKGGLLHTLPGFEDLLHAFAVGALNLRTNGYQRGTPPYYPLLLVRAHDAALRHGATQIDRGTFHQHKGQWMTHFQTNRQFVPENVELCQPCPPSTAPRQETAAGQGLA
jgi:hypothetical protein